MALYDDVALLKMQPALSVMHEDALRFLAFSSEEITLEPGDVLFRKGEKSTGVFLVRYGQLSLVVTESTETMELNVGDMIDEAGLLVEVTFQATAVARQKSNVLMLPRASIHRVLQEYPNLIEAWEKNIIRRLETARQIFEKANRTLPYIEDRNNI
jgi:CRP/FNR family transcriptional regulator, cyclic AMP receptor protein